MSDPCDILEFWWQAGPVAWFSSNEEFDAQCRRKWLADHEAAAAGRLDAWQIAPHSALALILLLDQMPRNMFRGTSRMFATDAQALEVADKAIGGGFHRAHAYPGRRFFYMPFMHAEDLVAQTRCVDLCRGDGDQDGYHFALVHMDAIRRFGRFPHRNEMLGRTTSDDERAYMISGGFSG